MTIYEPADWRPEPGDVASIVYDTGCEKGAADVALLNDADGRHLYWTSRDFAVLAKYVTHIKRLLLVDPASTVVLDPDNPDDVQRVAVALAMHDDGRHDPPYVEIAPALMRSLLPTPPLPEPNGLGAVVRGVAMLGEVRDEVEWVRALKDGGSARWALSTPSLRSGFERWWLWSAMRVTEVVSHGVGCTCGGPGCPGVDA